MQGQKQQKRLKLLKRLKLQVMEMPGLLHKRLVYKQQ